MLKKTLVAAAVTMGLSAGAFADVHLDNETGFDTTIIAKETKQSALDFSTAVEDLELTFDNPIADPANSIERELRNNGFLFVEIKNGIGAEFNKSQIDSWLTTNAAGTTLTGIEVDTDGDAVFTGSNAVSDLETVFKFNDLGNGQKRVKYELVGDTLRLELASDVEALANPNTKIHLKTSQANNIFKLYEDKNGNADKVVLTVAAQHNGSFTADRYDTPVVFDQTKTLFNTELAAGGLGTATALVNTYFENYKLGLQETGLIADSQNADINGVFNFKNNTSNQNIQKEQVRFTISGDFSGFDVDASNELLDSTGAKTGWIVNGDGDKAARYLGGAGITGGQELETITATLFNYDDPAIGDDGLYALKTPISSGTYSVKAELAQFNRDTGNLFKPVGEIAQTDSFYPVDDVVEKIIQVDRDGMKFDTITTGSTSSNKIFIRDVSNRLGEKGGKILVTIYEYEGMGANERANATGEVDVDNNNGIKTLVHRKALEQNGDYFTLPSGGAVTLTPEGVAEMAGVDVSTARQARFVFEVQTNMGEVAVRKKDDSGTDIQNGTRNVNRDNGDDGTIVDFTL
ncbi:hypothetical protein BZG79_12795 [Salinivibrio sp. MA427]|uniref:VapA family S-layer protein n=1 Tax=Salinivibrio sp. MA427 TaxID=1909455 RepID=UPI00098A101D|nr:hypothetical protein [Salinivibrio sp. MA427]OOF07987.1 hypothetical protein BZG79_12795 [Salinivibrio sp. MA427]